MLDRVVILADLLRRRGVEVSTGELIDAGRALTVLDVGDRATLHAALRSVMVKRETALAAFDRAFDQVFAEHVPLPADRAVAGDELDGFDGQARPVAPAGSLALSGADLARALDGDAGDLRALAARAVDMLAGSEIGSSSDRHLLHRILRALDVADMLSAAMRRLRAEGELSEFELSLRRHEIAMALAEFRRALAAEIARRRALGMSLDSPAVDRDPADRAVLELSRAEAAELRRTLQPLVRQLAARIGRRRRTRAIGRLDVRRTIRRSMQSGGIPLDPVLRRRHPHRPEVVLLCDVSGSVAEFARFTFALVHAVHDVLAGMHSFAFVDGVAEMTDVFAEARYDVPVHRILERRGVVGLDGHSDYAASFGQFVDRHLAATVTTRSTVIITGDARTNHRDPGLGAFRQICERARRVYWLNPEPRAEWNVDDSAIGAYGELCDAVFEVATVRQLSDVIASLV